MLRQKTLLKQTSFSKKIEQNLKLIKKREKHYNIGFHHISRPEKLISINTLIILLRLKKV